MAMTEAAYEKAVNDHGLVRAGLIKKLVNDHGVPEDKAVRAVVRRGLTNQHYKENLEKGRPPHWIEWIDPDINPDPEQVPPQGN